MSTTTDDRSTENPLADPEFRETLRELPPSAKLVAKVLGDTSPMSQGQLADESLLPDRTVRYALNRLEDENLVGSRYSFHDARKQVYFLVN
jgi:DNA-binding MarR family transcriptional regulator